MLTLIDIDPSKPYLFNISFCFENLIECWWIIISLKLRRLDGNGWTLSRAPDLERNKSER